MSLYNHGVPRTTRLDQGRRLTGKKIQEYCTENNIEPNCAPANDQRAIGPVERLIRSKNVNYHA